MGSCYNLNCLPQNLAVKEVIPLYFCVYILPLFHVNECVREFREARKISLSTK